MHQKAGTQSSRLKAKKKHVMKDIEEWMIKDLTLDLNQGNTRMSGKNDDTVTEIRMLKARLIDLGVERYKFLSHFSHQKQKFLDIRKRKESAVKNLRSYSTMSEPIMSIVRPTTTSSRHSVNDKSDGASSISRRTGFKSHKEYLNNDSRQLSLPVRARTVQFIQAPHTQQKSRDSRTVYSEPVRMNVPILTRENTMASSVYSGPTSVCSFQQKGGEDDLPWARRNKLSKLGGKCPSVTGDPRYAFLEKSLSTNYEKHIKTDVKDIVENIESLHKPSKNAKETKPKWGLKVFAYMKELGVTEW